VMLKIQQHAEYLALRAGCQDGFMWAEGIRRS
jgi:hypothetical protein